MKNREFKSAIYDLERKVDEYTKTIKAIREAYDEENYNLVTQEVDYLENCFSNIEDEMDDFKRAAKDYEEWAEYEEARVKEIVSIENSRHILNGISEDNMLILRKNENLKNEIDRGGLIDSSGYRSLITIASLENYDELDWALLAFLDDENIQLAKELVIENHLEPTDEAKIMVQERFDMSLEKEGFSLEM